MGGAEIYMRLVFQRQTKKILPNILTLAIGQVRERGYTMESWTSQPNQKMPHLALIFIVRSLCGRTMFDNRIPGYEARNINESARVVNDQENVAKRFQVME